MKQFLMDDFKIYIKTELGLSKETLSSYVYDVQELLTFLGTQEVTARSIEIFIDYLKSRKLKSTTIRRKYMSIRCLCHHLISLKYLDPNILNIMNSIRIERGTPNALNPSDVDILLDILEQDISTWRAINVRRNVAIILTLYDSGLRVSELCSLNLKNVNFNKREIRIIGKGRRERIVPTTSRCIKAIIDYINNGRRSDANALFVQSNNKRITRRTVSDMLMSLSRRANIKHTTAHTLRRSCATSLMNRGVDLELIQILLGHQHLSTTQNYLAINNNMLMDVYKRHHPFGEKCENQ